MVAVFSRYVVAGGAATIVHFGILILLVEAWAVHATLASALGFTASIFVNYTIQYHYTFASAMDHRVAFPRYVTVTTAMLGVNTLIFWTLNEMLGVVYVFSQVVATGVVLIFNFLINRYYTFAST